MCEEADEYNEVQTSTRVKARKEHKCCACSEAVRPGDFYMKSFTVFDSRVSSYKHCLRCWEMLEALQRALPSDTAIAWELNCGENWLNTIGDLPDEVAALAFMTPDDAQAKLASRHA